MAETLMVTEQQMVVQIVVEVLRQVADSRRAHCAHGGSYPIGTCSSTNMLP